MGSGKFWGDDGPFLGCWLYGCMCQTVQFKYVFIIYWLCPNKSVKNEGNPICSQLVTKMNLPLPS